MFAHLNQSLVDDDVLKGCVSWVRLGQRTGWALRMVSDMCTCLEVVSPAVMPAQSPPFIFLFALSHLNRAMYWMWDPLLEGPASQNWTDFSQDQVLMANKNVRVGSDLDVFRIKLYPRECQGLSKRQSYSQVLLNETTVTDIIVPTARMAAGHRPPVEVCPPAPEVPEPEQPVATAGRKLLRALRI